MLRRRDNRRRSESRSPSRFLLRRRHRLRRRRRRTRRSSRKVRTVDGRATRTRRSQLEPGQTAARVDVGEIAFAAHVAHVRYTGTRFIIHINKVWPQTFTKTSSVRDEGYVGLGEAALRHTIRTIRCINKNTVAE